MIFTTLPSFLECDFRILSREVLFTESLRRLSFAWSGRSSRFFLYRVCRFDRLSSVFELFFFQLLPFHWWLISGESPAIPDVHVGEPEGPPSENLNDPIASSKGWLAFQDLCTWLLHANPISKTEGIVCLISDWLSSISSVMISCGDDFLSFLDLQRFYFLLEYFIGLFKALFFFI